MRPTVVQKFTCLKLDRNFTVLIWSTISMEALMTSVTFRRGDQIDQREAGVSILQKYWKGFAPKDVSEWGLRIANSGGYVVAAYIGDAIAGILEAMSWMSMGIPSKFQPPSRRLLQTAHGVTTATPVTQ
jgi:hypothetical protein